MVIDMELFRLSATELSEMLSKGETTSEAIINSYYERIEKTEGVINAYVTLTKEQALEKARIIDDKRKNGEKLSKIAGLPVSLKDILCTNNVKTTCGSKMLENFIPPYSATVVEKLEEAGAISLGKLNMDEFAMGSSGETSYYGITRNPHDTERVPGGSSSGSAAAVAAGSALMTLGTDTGGSIRQPAAFCGIVGLKPTYGAVSRYGCIAFASGLDQIGPMGRTVKDVALLFDTITGKDDKDATSEKRTSEDFTQTMGKGIKGLKVGIPSEYFGEGISEEVKEAVNKAVKALEADGAIIKEVSLPSTKYALAAYYIIACAEASSNLSRFDGIKYGHRSENFTNLTELYENSRSEGFGEEVKRRIMLGTFVLSSGSIDAYYYRAKLLQKRIRQEFEAIFNECDVLITPTAPDGAFKVGENVEDPIKMYANDICTINVNIAGLPAMSVPCGVDKNNMPVGMQIIGKHFAEDVLFNVADHYENICGGFNKIASL